MANYLCINSVGYSILEKNVELKYITRLLSGSLIFLEDSQNFAKLLHSWLLFPTTKGYRLKLPTSKGR